MKHAVAIAEGGRTGEVRFLGEIENRPAAIERTIKKLGSRYDRLHVCFEARPRVRVVPVPGSWPRLHGGCAGSDPEAAGRAGQDEPAGGGHVGARLHRAGELTGVWLPDLVHEAVRDGSAPALARAAMFSSGRAGMFVPRMRLRVPLRARQA
jgi:transposase